MDHEEYPELIKTYPDEERYLEMMFESDIMSTNEQGRLISLWEKRVKQYVRKGWKEV